MLTTVHSDLDRHQKIGKVCWRTPTMKSREKCKSQNAITGESSQSFEKANFTKNCQILNQVLHEVV